MILELHCIKKSKYSRCSLSFKFYIYTITQNIYLRIYSHKKFIWLVLGFFVLVSERISRCIRCIFWMRNFRISIFNINGNTESWWSTHFPFHKLEPGASSKSVQLKINSIFFLLKIHFLIRQLSHRFRKNSTFIFSSQMNAWIRFCLCM